MPEARRIANWRFVRQLGKGGMAEVFEVEDERLGIRAAMKLFTRENDPDGQIRERFLAEAALLARLNHPHLVRVFDYGIDPASDRPYFVMDLVLSPSGEPKTLADKEYAGSDETRVAIWYDDLRDALSFIHARGIVHRDIKLQNVLVGPDGHAVLSDFGVAKIFDTSLREEVGLSPEETIHAAKGRRTVMGSLGYLAPELEMGVTASPASDYYALGVLVFYLLTGTWCEPRTDITGVLETYDPIWMNILPKLLHANPAARECPSWRECENCSREKDELDREERLASLEKTIGTVRRSNRIAQTIAAALGVCVIALAAMLASGRRVQATDIPRTRAPRHRIQSKDVVKKVKNTLQASGEFSTNKLQKALKPAKRELDVWISYVNRGELSYRAAAEVMYLLSQRPPTYPKVDSNVLTFMFRGARDEFLDYDRTGNGASTRKDDK